MKNRTLLILLALLVITSAKAQLWIENLDKYPDLKTKGVYVVLTDTTSETNKKYWHIYQKYWMYSSVKFMPYAEMNKYIQPGNYFFTFIRERSYKTGKYSSYWEADYTCSLSLWAYNGKNKNDAVKKEEILNGEVVRHINSVCGEALFSTEKSAFYVGNYKDNGEPHIPKLTYYTDYSDGVDANNLYFNWSEGLLKNYLQGLSWYAEQHKTIATEIYEKEQMELLKKDTLFVPDFAFTEYKLSKNSDIPVLVDKNNTKESISTDNQNVKNIFRRYKHPYKVISSQELSNKLLYDKKPFFYFLYTVSYTGKLITIINSLNGENIYATSSTKGEYNGIKEVLADRVTEIKLQVEDIDKLVEKMQTK